MAKFTYTAIDKNGRQKSGRVEADSENDARQKISAMGLMVSTLRKEEDAARGKRSGRTSAATKEGLSFGKAISQEGLTVFTRQIATLLQAGLPLLRSLEVMIRQEKNPAFKKILTGLADNVRSGNNLSDGLAQYPRTFDRLFINMVKAGEAGGILDVVLSRLATFQEKSLRTKKKIQSAMIYPTVVIFVALTIVIGLLLFIVPRFQNMFNEMLRGQPMPALTQFIVDISDYVKHNWLIILPVLVVLYFGYRIGVRTPTGATMRDWLILHFPKLKDLASKAAIVRFARTFGTLLSSGVPILQALQITRDVVGNTIIMRALDRVHDRVRDGESLATPLEQQKIFPTMVTSMIDVGEETGELAEMLNRIADNYDEDVDNAVNGITSIIEPVMIVFLAVVVGTIVVALFLPIVGIIQGISAG